MAPNPAPTFGKRRISSAPERPLAAALPGQWPPTAAKVAIEPVDTEREAKARTVPNSVSAGILTAAIIGVLHIVVHLRDNANATGQLGSVDVGGHQVSTLPLILLGSLWAGGEAGFSAAFIVHGVLRRIGRTRFVDYAVGGGAMALVGAGLFLLLGLGGPDEGWPIAIVTGAAAGLLYRLFAGAAPAA